MSTLLYEKFLYLEEAMKGRNEDVERVQIHRDLRRNV